MKYKHQVGDAKARLFENPVMEKLSRSSMAITLLLHLPIILLLTFLYFYWDIGSVGYYFLFLFSGVLFWTLFEYLMHRYVFHFVNENPTIKRFHFLAHGVHHEYPRDNERLWMPPLPTLVMVSLLIGFYSLFMGYFVLAFMPGFLFGYLAYVMTHYAIHKVKPPKGFEFIWRHHHIHHYQQPERAFGVSSPLWDYIFRTMPKETSKS